MGEKMNKVAFVTGSSRVTGKGIAIALAKAGYDVGITYTTNPEGAQDAVAQIEALGQRAKAYYMNTYEVKESTATLERFFEEFGHIDVMVNNTGLTRFKQFPEVTEEEFDTVISTNIRGTFFCGQAAARDMIKKNVKGVIVNISSLHAIGTWPGDSLYATTKAAICRLTQAQALDLAPYGIRVVCVAPGYINTGWQNRSEENMQRYHNVLARTPLGRTASGEEIGDAVVFMASDKASFITGTTLYVEGGVLLPVITENSYV